MGTAGFERELQQEQIEIGTAPVLDLASLRAELVQLRRAADEAAAANGVRLAAMGTSPMWADPSTTPVHRYQQMVDLYRRTANEQLTCGMHVHVETTSPDEVVGALDRIRPWLSVLLAQRKVALLAGPGHELRELTDAGLVALDDGMVYFDARLGCGLPTLEVRVADVCTSVEDAVLIAALSCALVDTAARAWHDGLAAPDVPMEVLKLGSWRTSRSALSGSRVHPVSGRAAPAGDVVGRPSP